MQAKELEAKLRANTEALKEAKSQAAAVEAKHKKELEAAIKAAEKAVENAKAQTTKAEDALSNKETEQATREDGVWLRLNKLSNSLGSKSFLISD
jgi:hypothetical protein